MKSSREAVGVMGHLRQIAYSNLFLYQLFTQNDRFNVYICILYILNFNNI